MFNKTNTNNAKYAKHTNATNPHTNSMNYSKHPHISSGDTNSKHDLTQKLSIINEIDQWISLIRHDNIDEQVGIYESKKSTWNEQTKYMLKELTRNHKNEILAYILQNVQSNSSNSSEKQKYKAYTLLNENIWVGKHNNSSFDDFEPIKNTFDILISNGFNFIEFSVLSNETSNKNEITTMLNNPCQFYLSVMKKDTRIPSDLQNDLFKYLSIKMNFKNREVFISSLQRNSNILISINTMIDSYYTEEKIIKRRLKSTESFLAALINKSNKIDSELRDRLYDYFTKIYWNREHFISCLTLMFNKITDSNSVLFIDNMQFILSRNVDVMSFEIFKLIVSRESTNITERNIMKGLLSNLVGREDLTMYFGSIDIELIKNQFINNILHNYAEWIEEVIQYQKLINPNVPINEFRTNNYGVLMMILGIAYSKGYKHDDILLIVLRIINETSINLIKPFGIFLETSHIKSNELNQFEQELISKYIRKFYFNTQIDMREKYIIETVLSNFVSVGQKSKIDIRVQQIDHFMNSGTFITIKYHPKKSSISPISLTNKFAGIYESDDEANDEPTEPTEPNEPNDKTPYNEFGEVEVEVEDSNDFPEPNELILRHINTYFRSNDVESSFDDLKYFIETAETDIKYKDFTYALFHSLSERTIRDIISIKILIQKISQIIGFEKIITELDELIKTNGRLIDIFKCDNPKIMDIINELN